MLRCLLLLGILSIGFGILPGEVRADGSISLPALFSPEKEMELALRAAPIHLRNEATVYVFGERGYEKART
jgi:hypothetical protein